MKGTHFYAGTKTKTAKVTLARSAVVFGYQVAVFDAGIIVQLGRIFFAAVAGDAGALRRSGDKGISPVKPMMRAIFFLESGEQAKQGETPSRPATMASASPLQPG